MKSSLYIRTICIALVMLIMTAFFTLGASANLGFRDGLGRNSDDPTQGTAGEDGVVPDTTPNDSAAGTGEFGDDTSDTSDAATDNTDTSSNDSSSNNESNSVDSAIDNTVTDATGAMDDAANDMADGMSIWGIVIVIAIIAAIAILIFAFFSRRK